MLRVVADEFKIWLEHATIFPRLGYITGEQIGYGGAILSSLNQFVERLLHLTKTEYDTQDFDYEELEIHEEKISAVFHAMVSILGLKGL